jgi:hypothetical protein
VVATVLVAVLVAVLAAVETEMDVANGAAAPAATAVPVDGDVVLDVVVAPEVELVGEVDVVVDVDVVVEVELEFVVDAGDSADVAGPEAAVDASSGRFLAPAVVRPTQTIAAAPTTPARARQREVEEPRHMGGQR